MPKKDRETLSIALNGASGRMGAELQKLIADDPGFKGKALISEAKDWSKIKAKDIDVVIDFSEPQGLRDAIEWCAKNKVALVSGTTGLEKSDFKLLAAAAKKIPLLYSANMSAGIAVMNAMLEKLKGIADWDFQIDEAHHIKKKDRPSGTALLLQRKLEQVLSRRLPEPNAIRGGGIPGIHTVWSMGPDETLVLTHTAFHRRVFAQGALYAARWLFDKAEPGLYDLTDLYK